ncbi:MAG: lysophospholipid acyltransferase family protein [Phycisphaerales bacterium]
MTPTSSSVRAESPWWARRVHAALRATASFVFRHAYKADASGAENVPATGPVLLVANHQSYLDPPLIGAMVPQRQLDYLARLGLFTNPLMRPFIPIANCIPIREQGGDATAIREVLRRLDAGRAVLIFPEGTRTPDGAMRPFKRGVAVLVKRARCPVVPIALEGCFDCWPRDREMPRIGGARRVAVRYAPAIPHDELMRDGADAGLARLARIVDGMRLDLRAEMRRRTSRAFPPPGAADMPIGRATA